jgi:hypothetical protein
MTLVSRDRLPPYVPSSCLRFHVVLGQIGRYAPLGSIPKSECALDMDTAEAAADQSIDGDRTLSRLGRARKRISLAS